MKKLLLSIIILAFYVLIGSTNVFASLPKQDIEQKIREDNNAFITFTDMKNNRNMGTYRLSKYDVIKISFLSPYQNSLEFTLGPDGFVDLPYVGATKLAGKTLEQTKEFLTETFDEYIIDPQISVMVTSYGVRQVFVMGQVTKEGIYSLTPEYLNIFAALSSAGGIKTKGRPKHVAVVRLIDGELVMKKVNFDSFVKKQDYTQNIVLEDGDMIYVPKSNKFDIYTDMAPILSAIGLYKIFED